MLHKLVRFLSLPLQEKAWFLLLYPTSGLVRAMILTVPFVKYAPLLGEARGNDQLAVLADLPARLRAQRLGYIVGAVADHTPWQTACLSQAILMVLMCRYYRIPYVMHLGVARGDGAHDPLTAHAWISVGPRIITGAAASQRHTVVYTCVTPGLLPAPVVASRRAGMREQ